MDIFFKIVLLKFQTWKLSQFSLGSLRIAAGLTDAANQVLSAASKGKKSKGKAPPTPDTSQDVPSPNEGPIKVILAFKRFSYDPDKKMMQT